MLHKIQSMEQSMKSFEMASSVAYPESWRSGCIYGCRLSINIELFNALFNAFILELES